MCLAEVDRLSSVWETLHVVTVGECQKPQERAFWLAVWSVPRFVVKWLLSSLEWVCSMMECLGCWICWCRRMVRFFGDAVRWWWSWDDWDGSYSMVVLFGVGHQMSKLLFQCWAVPVAFHVAMPRVSPCLLLMVGHLDIFLLLKFGLFDSLVRKWL